MNENTSEREMKQKKNISEYESQALYVITLWFRYACPAFFSFSQIPLRKWVWLSLFVKTLTLTLRRFIVIDPAHHLPRAPGSSLVPLRLCTSPGISSGRRKACDFPQSSLNCVQEWAVVPSELPAGGFQ